MSEYLEDFTYRSTVTEKQECKIKSHHHHEEACKCFSPFVKLHHHNCPMATKPCPVHGNLFQNTKKKEKNRKENVIISFHPSSKTEKLLQPIKSLLANCRSDTKINFQYYSPSNSASRESLKSSPSLTAYENLKKTINNNVFVEKTKSFVADKTNKVKKLRQCFHSPCNSIAQKTRSHTSVQEKLNQILREEVKQTKNLYNMVPEIPPDDKKSDPGLKWLYPTELNFKSQVCEKPSKKRNSDYITVTQRDKNNIVNHKVFEIKHKKDLTDVPFVGFPKEQTQFVYSSIFGSVHTPEYATYRKYDQKDQKQLSHADVTPRKSEKLGRNIDEVYSSEKSQRSTSSSSVYITPFIFLPKATDDNESEKKTVKEEDSPLLNAKKQPLTNSAHSKQSVDQVTQTSSASRRSVIQTTSTFYTSDEELKFVSTSVQTDPYLIEKSPKYSTKSKMVEVSTYEQPQRALEEVDKSEVFVKRDYDIRKLKQNRRRLNPEQTTRSVDVQAGCSCSQREVLITARWGARDQTCQTEDSWNICLSVKTFESKSNKSQMTCTPQHLEKAIQTSPSSYSEDFDHGSTPEFVDRNLSYVIKPIDAEESDQAVDKIITWWKKSHSDGDLYTRTKSESTKLAENVHPSTSSDYESKSNEVSETVKEPSFKTKETSTKEDFPPTVSDLSELRKLIQEIFEKENFNKTCDCKTAKIKGGKVDNETMTENSFLKPEKRFANAEVQTINPKPERVNVQAQTSIHVLLDEAQQKPGPRTYLRQSVTVDQLSATKTYYVCAMCGGEIKTLLKDVSTSTENVPFDHSRRKEKTTVVESACTETVQVRMLKNCQCGANKNSLDIREKSQRSPPKERRQGNSNIPVSLPPQTGSVRFKTNDNTSTIIHVETRGVNQKPARLYNQEDVGVGTIESHERSKGAKKQQTPDANQSSSRTEDREVQDSRSRKKNTDFIFPVFIKPLWTKELMQTWKSMENTLTDYDSDSYTKSPISKQKRSYGKDELTEIAAGKKIKVGLEGLSREYPTFDASSISSKKENSIKKSPGVLWVPCSSSSCLKNESSARVKSANLEKTISNTISYRNPAQVKKFTKNCPNNFFKIENSESESYYVQLWPEDMIPQESRTPEEESSISIDEIFDEEIPQNFSRENSLRNEEELHEECEHFFDSNYSPRTEGINVLEEESAEEIEAPPPPPHLEYYYQNPEMKPQSHTVLTCDKFLSGNVNPTSRSLNTFHSDEDFEKKRSINNEKYEK